MQYLKQHIKTPLIVLAVLDILMLTFDISSPQQTAYFDIGYVLSFALFVAAYDWIMLLIPRLYREAQNQQFTLLTLITGVSAIGALATVLLIFLYQLTQVAVFGAIAGFAMAVYHAARRPISF